MEGSQPSKANPKLRHEEAASEQADGGKQVTGRYMQPNQNQVELKQFKLKEHQLKT